MNKFRFSTLIVTSIVIVSGIIAQSQPQAHDHSAMKMKAAQKTKAGSMQDPMMKHCMMMMLKNQKMAADLKEQDTKLDDLFTKVSAAPEAEKVEALSAVVQEMIVQRKAERSKMASMHSEMMTHMMEHMEMGKKSMMKCPMMANMMGGMAH